MCTWRSTGARSRSMARDAVVVYRAHRGSVEHVEFTRRQDRVAEEVGDSQALMRSDLDRRAVVTGTYDGTPLMRVENPRTAIAEPISLHPRLRVVYDRSSRSLQEANRISRSSRDGGRGWVPHTTRSSDRHGCAGSGTSRCARRTFAAAALRTFRGGREQRTEPAFGAAAVHGLEILVGR